MEYPALEEVETATTEQIREWFRYLQPPASGISYHESNYIEVYENRIAVLNRIVERFDDASKEEEFAYEVGDVEESND